MKRTMAMMATVSVLALLVLTGQASAQDGPSLSADPPAVDGPGTYSFTLTGSGWSPGLLIFIVPCTLPGDQLTTASSMEEIVASSSIGQDSCVLAPLGSVPVGADGTFSVDVTHDVPGNFAFGAGDAGSTETSAAPILFIADDMDMDMDMADDMDMGDDMAPDGAAETGFGATAGSGGDSAAAPLAATLAAVALLSGGAIVARRHA